VLRIGGAFSSTGLHSGILVAISIISTWAWGRQEDVYLAHGVDAKHTRGSLHYTGGALDIWWKGINLDDAIDVAHQLRLILGSDYDVIAKPDHVHIEWQPKGPIN
jgi:hypothetical protein